MAEAANGRDDAVDIARGLAIFYVVAVWHGNDYFGGLWSNPATRLLTSCALGYFFCVSAALVSRRQAPFRNRDDVGSFLKRRFRLYPEYLLALVLFWSLSLVNAKSALLGLFALNPPLDVPLRTLWFVAMLFFFQATVPALLWKTGDPRRILPKALLVFAALFAAHWFLGIVDARLLRYWPVFVAGLILNRDGGELRLPRRGPRFPLSSAPASKSAESPRSPSSSCRSGTPSTPSPGRRSCRGSSARSGRRPRVPRSRSSAWSPPESTSTTGSPSTSACGSCRRTRSRSPSRFSGSRCWESASPRCSESA